MSTRLATVHFPDGTRKYARYSTTVGAVHHPLYARPALDGEPDPNHPGLPPEPADQLLPVVVGVEPGDRRWHALFSPRRAMLLGPLSPHHHHELQQNLELIPDDQDVRHLCRFAVREEYIGPVAPNSLCGRVLRDRPLPYLQTHDWLTGLPTEQPPDTDLYAQWHRPDLCHPCLIVALVP